MIELLPEELSKALDKEDELGLVLRAHLYIENKLEELLYLLVPVPRYYEEMNLNYVNKVKLACALGLDPGFKGMLLVLGSIRNKFAHNLSKKIDAEMVKNLHSVAHEKYRNMLPSFINKISVDNENLKSFNEVHPRDQFTTLVMTLWVVLNGAIQEAKGD